MFGDNLRADLDSPRTLEVSRVVSLQNTRDKCGRNPKNAKHDSETILNDSPKGEVSSWRANQQPIWNENRDRASTETQAIRFRIHNANCDRS